MENLKNAIIFIDMENQGILRKNRLLSILNLLNKEFKIQYIMNFGNFLNKKKHIDKIYERKDFIKYSASFNNNLLNIIKEVLNFNSIIPSYFISNIVHENAADENIKELIKLNIFERHHLKENDVFILISQDTGFKYDLDLLEKCGIKCLLIGGNLAMDTKFWGNIKKFIFDINYFKSEKKLFKKFLKNNFK